MVVICFIKNFQVGSRPFIIPNDTDVYCVGCFEEKFATKCTKCKKVMNSGGVTFKNEVRDNSLNNDVNKEQCFSTGVPGRTSVPSIFTWRNYKS